MLRLAHLPNGHFFRRDPFLGEVTLSPKQKAEQLLALPGSEQYKAQIKECLVPWEEAAALRKYSGGWGKLSDMMAPEEAMACLAAVESRISAQSAASLGDTSTATVKKCPLGVLAAVGVVGLAAAALLSLRKG